VEAGNPSFSSVDGVLYDGDQQSLLLFPRARKGDYYLPNSLVSIYDACFDNCTELTVFIVQEDNPAFSALDGTLFNQGQNRFGSSAAPRQRLFPLTEWADGNRSPCFHPMPRAFPAPFNLPKTITKIGDRSFYHCSLNQNDGIVIGTNTEFFGSNAFLESGLSRVYFEGDETQWNSIPRKEDKGLAQAAVYFLREDQPQEAGRFWHYVDGAPPFGKQSLPKIKTPFLSFEFALKR